jgi:glutamate synthase (NADPH) small chain
MIDLTINGKKVSVPEESSVLAAAEQMGIKLPTLCYFESCGAFASCMVCLVKNMDTGKLIPACSSLALEGMRVETDSEEVIDARKAALELLLSEHMGDCEAICRVACPAYVNVPEMIRKIKDGDINKHNCINNRNIKSENYAQNAQKDIPNKNALVHSAAKVLLAGVALPRVIGRICHAPCQKACKRGRYDEAVSIRQLEKYVADANFAEGNAVKPEKTTGKRVAVIGSGPTGLSAAFYLSLLGHQCVCLEKNDKLGGGLRYNVSKKDLPHTVLDEEIDVIKKLGCEFRTNAEVAIFAEKTGQVSFDSICDEYDAVVISTGADLTWLGQKQVNIQETEYSLQPGAVALQTKKQSVVALETGDKGLKIDYGTFLTSIPGVFAGGDVLISFKQVVRSVADGRSISQSVDSFLRTGVALLQAKEFDSRSGKNTKDIVAAEVRNANSGKAVFPQKSGGGATTPEEERLGCVVLTPNEQEEALQEAGRCLNCDCAKATKCKLRDFATEYGAVQSTYKAVKSEIDQSACKKSIAGEFIFDPGKCIKCGVCVRLAQKYPDEAGMTFIGRGITTRIAVPFDDPLGEGLNKSAKECI